MPRNAVGVKVEGSNTPGREEEERREEGGGVKTKKKKPTGLHNILFKRKLNKNIVEKITAEVK